MSSHRTISVARELQRELADILRTEVDDPLIGFVTITDVTMSPDLRHARVYFSALGSDEQRQAAFRGLRRAAKFIRGLLAQRMELRYTPTLRFYLDDTPERAQRIEALIIAEHLAHPQPPSDAHEAADEEQG